MEHETIKYPENDIEDGEISDSDDGYTPLARPATSERANHVLSAIAASSTVSKMEEASDKDESLPEPSSSDDSDSDHPRGKSSTKPKLRFKALSSMTPVVPKIKKNNIWATGLQEESLMENLKGCGVDQESSIYDRSVESYDYSLKYRLADANPRKRRQSTNSDSSTDQELSAFNQNQSKHKRFRANSMGNSNKRNVRLRLGNRNDDDSSSNDGALNAPRIILDLNVLNGSNEELARDLANKLYEEKDDLLLRIVDILGSKLPLEIFKETQKIESLGGMLIMNGQRRRTPGGVFLFLLKNSADLEHAHKKMIFAEESKKHAKDLKHAQAMKRDRKVEQLKKTLKNETNDLPVLSTRGDLMIKDETLNNLSNPPPSPVTDGNRENSSDFDNHHVNVTSPEKAGPSSKVSITDLRQAAEFAQQNQQRMLEQQQHSTTPSSYQDDFLDMNCDDMDLF